MDTGKTLNDSHHPQEEDGASAGKGDGHLTQKLQTEVGCETEETRDSVEARA